MEKDKCILCDMHGSFKKRLGHATWTFLEHLVEGYPEKPDNFDMESMTNLIKYMSRVYPCLECRQEFMGYVENFPPLVSSRKELYEYFVNMKKYMKYGIV